MKLIRNIAILTGLIFFISSCQKEKLPDLPGSSSIHESSTERHTSHSVIKDGDDQSKDADAIIGGGDDDHDGGHSRGERRLDPSSGSGSDSVPAYNGTDDENLNPDGIIGGGDDDHDGGGKKDGKKGG
jgi:hypothetical protein